MHGWPRKDEIKTEISLQNVRVIRKHGADKKPGLEIVAGESGLRYNIFIKPDVCSNPLLVSCLSTCVYMYVLAMLAYMCLRIR